MTLLTGRQRDIIQAILDGCTNSEMADRLGIREQTVKNHLTAIFQKTGASSRLELAIIALQTHLLDPHR